MLKTMVAPNGHTPNEPHVPVREGNGNANGQLNRNGKSSDHALQLYLTQMSRIPMLSREQEISIARNIRSLRKKLRCAILASDFVLEGVVKMLSTARDGSLRLDRLMEISFSDMNKKSEVMTRMEPNLATLAPCFEETVRTFGLRSTSR